MKLLLREEYKDIKTQLLNRETTEDSYFPIEYACLDKKYENYESVKLLLNPLSGKIGGCSEKMDRTIG